MYACARERGERASPGRIISMRYNNGGLVLALGIERRTRECIYRFDKVFLVLVVRVDETA